MEIADDNDVVNRVRIQRIIIDTIFYSANPPSTTKKKKTMENLLHETGKIFRNLRGSFLTIPTTRRTWIGRSL